MAAPPVPTGLKVTLTPTSMSASCDPSTGAAEYTWFLLAGQPRGNPLTAADRLASPTTAVPAVGPLVGLAPNTQYEIQVRARGGLNNGDWSGPAFVDFTTPIAATSGSGGSVPTGGAGTGGGTGGPVPTGGGTSSGTGTGTGPSGPPQTASPPPSPTGHAALDLVGVAAVGAIGLVAVGAARRRTGVRAKTRLQRAGRSRRRR